MSKLKIMESASMNMICTPPKDGEFVQNAVINSASINIERGFVLTSWLHLDCGGTFQGFGGYGLAVLPFDDTAISRETKGHCGEWIRYVMTIADVEDWSKLKGKTIRVIMTEKGLGGKILGIGHIVDDKWFRPKEIFEQYSVSN